MSSSSSTVTGDDKFRQSETVIAGDLSAPNMSTEAISFSSGNPRIEETRGVMHLFSNDAVSTLPVSSSFKVLFQSLRNLYNSFIYLGEFGAVTVISVI